MKIALILGQFPCLSETFILNQITGLIDLGHDVRIFALSNPKEPKLHQDFQTYRLDTRTTYLPPIPKNRFLRNVLAIAWLARLSLKHPMCIARGIRCAFKGLDKTPLLRQLYWLSALSKENVDIIHCHFGQIGIIGARLKQFGIKAKLVTTFHGYDLSQYLVSKSNTVYQILFQQGDLFLPISEYWKNKLIDMGCEENKIRVHHMGVDLETLDFVKRELPSQGPLNLLSIGRLVEKKGHAYALHAIAKCLQKTPNIHYTIAGEGPLKKNLEKQTTDLALKNHVTFLGQIDSTQVRNLLSETHLFLLPSVTATEGDQEGIPVVLMEAQAVGLPVISTFHSGIPELVQDQKSGYLVPEKDDDALAQKLSLLIEHHHDWPAMGKCGREFVENNFNIKCLNKKLVQLYEKLKDSQK